MITLYQFKPYRDWGVSSLSPFCIKLETYLKMANKDYRCVYLDDPRKAPKGKLPYIVDGDVTIADSSFIIDHFEKEGGINQSLNKQQQALLIANQRLLEDHLYWVLVYSRWIDTANWKVIKPIYFASMPTVIRLIIPELLKKGILKSLKHQGLGRHAKQDIYNQGKQSLEAISHLLGDQLYFFNNQPSTLDAMAYGFLSSLLYPPLNSSLKDYVSSQPNLVRFCDNIRHLYFNHSS